MPKMVPDNSSLQLCLSISGFYFCLCKVRNTPFKSMELEFMPIEMEVNDTMNANPSTENYFLIFFCFLSIFVNHIRYIDSKLHITICYILHAALGKVNICYFVSRKEIIVLREDYQMWFDLPIITEILWVSKRKKKVDSFILFYTQ